MSEASQDNVWPLPKFYFSVKLDEFEINFQEVSGLESDCQIIEYRQGDSKLFSTINMPGIQKIGNVTLKKGVFPNDNSFWDWYNEIKMNTINRQTVEISLLDEVGNTTMAWTLSNAWPTKVSGTDLQSEGNEIAVESIEIAYETLIIANP